MSEHKLFIFRCYCLFLVSVYHQHNEQQKQDIIISSSKLFFNLDAALPGWGQGGPALFSVRHWNVIS